MYNIEVYVGKQTVEPYDLSNKPFDIINILVLPISKIHCHITFNNWFTSVDLIFHLFDHHKLTVEVRIKKKNKHIWILK